MDGLKRKGYVLKLDDQGYYSLVHYTQAYGSSFLQENIGTVKGQLVESKSLGGQAVLPAPGAPVKRTPQERLQSMVNRMWPTVKDLGHIPGLKDEDLLPIMANARMKSLDPKHQRMTAEDVRAIAAQMLTTAEAKHEEKLAKQVTRHED